MKIPAAAVLFIALSAATLPVNSVQEFGMSGVSIANDARDLSQLANPAADLKTNKSAALLVSYGRFNEVFNLFDASFRQRAGIFQYSLGWRGLRSGTIEELKNAGVAAAAADINRMQMQAGLRLGSKFSLGAGLAVQLMSLTGEERKHIPVNVGMKWQIGKYFRIAAAGTDLATAGAGVTVAGAIHFTPAAEKKPAAKVISEEVSTQPVYNDVPVEIEDEISSEADDSINNIADESQSVRPQAPRLYSGQLNQAGMPGRSGISSTPSGGFKLPAGGARSAENQSGSQTSDFHFELSWKTTTAYSMAGAIGAGMEWWLSPKFAIRTGLDVRLTERNVAFATGVSLMLGKMLVDYGFRKSPLFAQNYVAIGLVF